MTRESNVRHPVEELAEDFVARSRRGERPAVADYVKMHPELAAEIEELFPALVFLEKCGQVAPSVTTVEIGRLGDYRLVRELGRGGMGIVYEAVQESLGRSVALKVLPAESHLKPKWLDRFQREAEAAARLHHTNIVPVYGVGAADGHHFFAMQFIDGESLRDLLARATGSVRTAEFPSPANPTVAAADASTAPLGKSATSAPGSYLREVAQIGVQVADALAYAHGQGILHRDIKPGNLMRDRQGTIWVTDFGLAKVEGADDLTATGDLVGTLRYMPPERFQGKEDARSDIYSLGLTLYELAGRRPAFDQTDRTRLMDQLMHDTPTPLRQINPRIPRDLETIIHKAMDRDPARRYANAAELADDLRRFLADMPVLARRISSLEQARRWCARNPVLAGLMSFSVCLLVVVSVVSLVAYFRISSALAAETLALDAETCARKDADRRKIEADLARTDAERRKIEADNAKEGEKVARQDAERDRDAALETLYTSRMSLAQRAWGGGEVDVAMKTLEEAKPKAGQKDFRGWEWYFLEDQSRRVVHTLDLRKPGVPGAVFAAAYSPNGQWLAVDNGRMKVLIIDCKTKQIQHELPHPLSVHRLAWSPDSGYLATIAFSGPVRLWDPATGALLKTLQPPKTVLCASLAWSPDSKQIATAFGKEPTIWDVKQARLEVTLPTLGFILAWSPDGERLAVSDVGRAISIWDVSKRAVISSLPGHKGSGVALAWHRDNVRLASAGSDGTTQIWNTATKQALLTLPGGAKDVAWNPEGDRIATVGSDRALRVWNAEDGQLEVTLRNHDDMITTVSWHPDGQRLATASTDNRVNLWNVTAYRQSLQGAFAKADKSPYYPRSLSPDGKREYRVDLNKREFTFLDSATKAPIRVFSMVSPEHVRWSPVNRNLAWLAPKNEIRLWDDERQEERLLLTGWIRFFLWSQDGKLLAACGHDGIIQVCDVASGKRVCVIEGREKQMRLALSPRGDYLVSSGASEKARVWNISTGLLVGEFHVGVLHTDPNTWFARWSPASRQMVLPVDERGLRVVDTATWKDAFTLRAHADMIASVAWSPDGKRLASLSHIGTKAHVVLWNTSTGLEAWAFSYPITKFSGPRLMWSSDGRRLTCETIKGSYSWDAPISTDGPLAQEPIRTVMPAKK